MRSFQENKCDLCYKYNLTEIEQLRSENRLGRLNHDDSTENDLHDPEFEELIDKANLQDDFFQKLD